jgi:hypothetical protein
MISNSQNVEIVISVLNLQYAYIIWFHLLLIVLCQLSIYSRVLNQVLCPFTRDIKINQYCEDHTKVNNLH